MEVIIALFLIVLLTIFLFVVLFIYSLPFLAVMFLVAFFLISFFIYFLPTFVARSRKKKNVAAIFVLNLFLGWAFIGWVIALIWAFMSDANNKK